MIVRVYNLRLRDTLINIVAIGAVIGCIGIIGYQYYSNHVIVSHTKNAVMQSKIDVKTVKKEESKTTNKPTDTVSNVSSNQRIKKVHSYKNVIQIKRLKILAYINEGVDRDAIRYGVGHHENTVKVGEKGNCVLVGHSSSIYDCIFNNLKNIRVAEQFYLYDAKGKRHTYAVVQKYVVEPTDTSLFNYDRKDMSRVTIYTCTNGGTQRLVVVADELNVNAYKNFIKTYKEKNKQALVRLSSGYNLDEITKELGVRSDSISDDGSVFIDWVNEYKLDNISSELATRS